MKIMFTKLLVVLVPLLLLSSQAVSDIRIGATFSKGEVDIIATWYRDHGTPSAHGNGRKNDQADDVGDNEINARNRPR